MRNIIAAIIAVMAAQPCFAEQRDHRELIGLWQSASPKEIASRSMETIEIRIGEQGELRIHKCKLTLLFPSTDAVSRVVLCNSAYEVLDIDADGNVSSLVPYRLWISPQTGDLIKDYNGPAGVIFNSQVFHRESIGNGSNDLEVVYVK